MQQVITLNANGISKLSYNEIQTEIESRMLEVEPSLIFRGTPAGVIRDIATEVVDVMASQIISMFHQLTPRYAEGFMLDVVGMLQGLPRSGGSKTIQSISVTVDRVTTLVGGIFKVKDASQNVYVLQTTQTNLPAGTYLLVFEAEFEGNIESGLNSINIIETPQVGVVSVNNTVAPTFIGNDIESDARFRVRLEEGKQINSLGYLGSLLSQLGALQGVVSVNVLQNRTDAINALGIPARNIACVLEGGDEDMIVDIISKNVVTPTFGDIGIPVILPNAVTEMFYFSRPTNTPIFIKITVKNINAYSDFDFIREAIVNNVGYDITQVASSDKIIQITKEIPNIKIIITEATISLDGINYFDFIENNSYKQRYIFDFDKITFIEL